MKKSAFQFWPADGDKRRERDSSTSPSIGINGNYCVLPRSEYPTGSDCEHCGRPFTFGARRRAKLYCSSVCRLAGRRAALRSSGQPYIGPGGYRYVLIAGAWRAEHVVVMERELERPLREQEHVLHKDGSRSNNAPENLELRSKGAAPGARPYGATERSCSRSTCSRRFTGARSHCSQECRVAERERKLRETEQRLREQQQ